MNIFLLVGLVIVCLFILLIILFFIGEYIYYDYIDKNTLEEHGGRKRFD